MKYNKYERDKEEKPRPRRVEVVKIISEHKKRRDGHKLAEAIVKIDGGSPVTRHIRYDGSKNKEKVGEENRAD